MADGELLLATLAVINFWHYTVEKNETRGFDFLMIKSTPGRVIELIVTINRVIIAERCLA
jgi:hypothetical protein